MTSWLISIVGWELFWIPPLSEQGTRHDNMKLILSISTKAVWSPGKQCGTQTGSWSGEKGQHFKSILSLVIKRKVVQNVNRMSENIKSVCQYVHLSICQYVRMQLFSLGIKMKVVQNDIRMSDSQTILVSKFLLFQQICTLSLASLQIC